MSQTTIDHDKIRKWTESKGGKPTAFARTHAEDGDVGLIRLMFPKSKQAEHANLGAMSRDEFFAKFEQGSLALVYEDSSLRARNPLKATHYQRSPSRSATASNNHPHA